MSTSYRFCIPILDYPVLVSFADDYKEGKTEIDKFVGTPQEEEAEPVAFVWSDKGKSGVWLGANPERWTVAHEATHIVQDAFDYIEAKMGKDNELDAHFIEFVTKKIFERLDKHLT